MGIDSIFFFSFYLSIYNSCFSNNPLGSNRNLEKLPFHPYFTIKDFLGFLFVLTLFFIFILNKLGGVVAMILSIVVWFTLPLRTCACFFQRNKFIKYNQLLVWVFFNRFLILTWIGARPVEDPYIMIGLVTTIVYFSFISIMYIPQKFLNSFK